MRTFDIRFAKSQGLASLFEAPANSLGWKGAGRLSIDARGIRIAMKRGLLTLFSRRARHFSADSLAEAYREADALRLVFQSDDRSEVLPVWARGDNAAEIVKLLPTRRTVELDHATMVRRFRPDWNAIGLAVIALIAVVGASVSLLLRHSSSPLAISSVDGLAGRDPAPAVTGDEAVSRHIDASREARRTTADPNRTLPVSGRTGETGSPRETGVPRLPVGSAGNDGKGSPALTQPEAGPASSSAEARASAAARAAHVDAARLLLDMFERQSGNGIDDEGWWEFTVLVYTAPEFQGRDLWVICDAMLAVSRAWRAHDVEFAQGLTGQVHMLAREAL